ncbi:hypothetical protein C2E23DRAFT_594481 [Lenzites betulinus]|nr:hypothetical protein C2E23DRAFT_594481 [Lenzites betulinus]
MPKTSDSCWSFSLRGGGPGEGCSSDDDSEGDGKTRVSPSSDKPYATVSEEARLLGELDLASRTDAATYKPNPWSIAKVNASTRPSKPPRTLPKKPAQSTKTKKATVLDLLRAQPEKNRDSAHAPHAPLAPTSHSSTNRNSVSGSHILDVRSDNSLQEEAHIPSDETLVDSSYQPSLLCKVESPASLGRFVSPLPSRNLSPVVVAQDLASRAPTASDFAASSGLLYRNPVLSGTSHTMTHSVSSDSTGLRHGISVPISLGPSTHPHTLSTKVNEGEQVGPDATSTVARPWALSPARPRHHVDVAHSRRFDETGRNESSAMSHKPTWKREWRSPDLNASSYVNPEPPFALKCESSPGVPSQPAYTHAFPRSTSTPAVDSQTQLVRRKTRVPGHFEDILPWFAPPAPTSGSPRPWLHKAQMTREGSSGIPAPLKMRPSPKKLVTPLVSRRARSPSPIPSPLPQQRKQHSSYADKKHQPKRDAYNAFGSPHESWSTLPTKKARTTGKEKMAAVSGKFKIPVQRVPPNNSSARGNPASGSDAFSGGKRHKVVTYLPPPPKYAAPRRDFEDVADTAPPTSMFQPLVVRRAAPPSLTLSAYKYDTSKAKATSHPNEPTVNTPRAADPSPMVSPTLLSPVASPSACAYTSQDWEADDITVPFSTSGFPSRYGYMRQSIAERKRLSAEVWSILDLPSCGVVFRDEWRRNDIRGRPNASGPGQDTGMSCSKQQISIVVWQGSAQVDTE